jgi:hypothetical protein
MPKRHKVTKKQGKKYDLPKLQHPTKNTYEIMHRGRVYTIIYLSHNLGGGFKLYINGGKPKVFSNIPQLMLAYPHIGKELSEIYNAEFSRR